MVIHNPPDLLSFTLWSVSRKIQKELDVTLGHFNLTYVQFLILQSIENLNLDQKFVTQQDVASKLIADKNTVSQCIKLLHQKKYLKRTKHPADARAKILILTPDGSIKLLQTKKLMYLKESKFKYK
jgi:DNA-binding MarR family transcriptional regulator